MTAGMFSLVVCADFLQDSSTRHFSLLAVRTRSFQVLWARASESRRQICMQGEISRKTFIYGRAVASANYYYYDNGQYHEYQPFCITTLLISLINSQRT